LGVLESAVSHVTEAVDVLVVLTCIDISPYKLVYLIIVPFSAGFHFIFIPENDYTLDKMFAQAYHMLNLMKGGKEMVKRMVIGLLFVAAFVGILIVSGCQTSTSTATTTTTTAAASNLNITNISPYALGQ